MSTMYATPAQTVSGTTIKKALTFLKQVRPLQYMSNPAFSTVCVSEGYWYTTNLYFQARVPAPIEIPEGLYDLMAVLPVLTASPAAIAVEENGIRLNGLAIPRMGPVEDFPFLPVNLSESQSLGPVPALWNTAIKFVAETDTRPVLKGILLSPTMHAVASNGSRLVRLQWTELFDLPRPIICPAYALKTPATLSVDTQQNILHFTHAEGIMTVRAIDSQFPENWAQLIPDPREAHWQGQCSGKTLREWIAPLIKLAGRKQQLSLAMKTGEGQNPTVKTTPFFDIMEGSPEGEDILVNPSLFNFLGKETDTLSFTWTTYGIAAPIMGKAPEITVLILPLRHPI